MVLIIFIPLDFVPLNVIIKRVTKGLIVISITIVEIDDKVLIF